MAWGSPNIPTPPPPTGGDVRASDTRLHTLHAHDFCCVVLKPKTLVLVCTTGDGGGGIRPTLQGLSSALFNGNNNSDSSLIITIIMHTCEEAVQSRWVRKLHNPGKEEKKNEADQEITVIRKQETYGESKRGKYEIHQKFEK